MDRNICICQDFLTDAHKAQITAAAEAAGMVPHFFTTAQTQEAKDCLQSCEVLYAGSPDLLRAAPASLKWYCAASAGVDVYCKDDSLFANPDCLLTNSNAYGVTIAEHTVMVTIMLLRHMPAYVEGARLHQWLPPQPVRSIHGGRFTILGTGNLGGTIARRIRDLGAGKIVALSRSGKARQEGLFDEVRPISDLNAVLPEMGIISCGVNNKYGHPHEETLSILRDAGVDVYRTDLLGTITIGSDGQNYTVGTEHYATDAELNPTAPAASSTAQQAYIGNVNSKKFHLPTCPNLPAEKNQILFSSYDEAVAAGYTPCSTCIQ